MFDSITQCICPFIIPLFGLVGKCAKYHAAYLDILYILIIKLYIADCMCATLSYLCQCQEGHQRTVIISDLNQMALWLFLVVPLPAILLTQAECHLWVNESDS